MDDNRYPSYLALAESGELQRRVEALQALAAPCYLCPRDCATDRRAGERGACWLGWQAHVDSYGLHRGEEAPIAGSRGSGIVFFGACNMKCQFCYSHKVSHGPGGTEVSVQELAAIYLDLQRQGAHNLNLCSPTHVVHEAIAALALAVPHGFRLPIVYNCGGYEALEAVRLLDGIVDLYLPDYKFGSDDEGYKLSGVRGYVGAVQAAIAEMHRQVGDLELDEQGVARRGVLVRHLLMPGDPERAPGVFRFLADQISRDTVVSLMDQWTPAHRSKRVGLGRKLLVSEVDHAAQAARDAGLHRIIVGQG